MLSRNQKLKDIVRILESENESNILDTIKYLYVNGTVEILPYLFRLYFITTSTIIQREILGLLNDVKDNKACPYFVDAVRTFKGQEYFYQIVSSCWQNGLDFSSDIQLFIDLVIEQDILTAIEAFSVVEENISSLNPSERENKAFYIQSKLKVIDKERKKLVAELLNLVENTSGPFKVSLN